MSLDVLNYPWLLNGSCVNYQRGYPPIGNTALRFSRMFSEREVLYDIMALDVSDMASARMGLQSIGQLIVSLSPEDARKLPGAGSPIDLSVRWDVEPLGTVDGTNALGGPVTVPHVRFWGFTSERRPRNLPPTSERMPTETESSNAAQPTLPAPAQAHAALPGNTPFAADSAITSDQDRRAAVLRYTESGREQLRDGRYADAIVAYEKALELDPSDPQLHNYKGYALLRNNRAAEAVDTLRRATELEPSYALAYYNLALAYWARGDHDHAIASVQRALELDPSKRSAIQRDPQFREFRRSPEFLRLLEGAGG